MDNVIAYCVHTGTSWFAGSITAGTILFVTVFAFYIDLSLEGYVSFLKIRKLMTSLA